MPGQSFPQPVGLKGHLCLNNRFDSLYAQGVGRPGHPIRLMVGLQLLKDTSNLSDEEVVALWIENPHWQYFCGEQYFYHHSPIDPSLMTGFRKRIGQDGCELILSLTVSAGLATKTVTKSFLSVVNVDTTVQDKAVAFPTDARLLNKAGLALVRHAHKLGVVLRQSYRDVGRAAFVRARRYAHARQYNRAQAQTKKLRTYLGRIIRDIERKTQATPAHSHLARLCDSVWPQCARHERLDEARQWPQTHERAIRQIQHGQL